MCVTVGLCGCYAHVLCVWNYMIQQPMCPCSQTVCTFYVQSQFVWPFYQIHMLGEVRGQVGNVASLFVKELMKLSRPLLQAVRLESAWSDRVRYMVVVYTSGRQDTEENILLGIDFSDKDRCVWVWACASSCVCVCFFSLAMVVLDASC